MKEPGAAFRIDKPGTRRSKCASNERTKALERLRRVKRTVRTRFFRARHLLRKSLSSELQSALRDTFAFDGERCDRIVRTVLARVID
jgi:hypothetical protein